MQIIEIYETTERRLTSGDVYELIGDGQYHASQGHARQVSKNRYGANWGNPKAHYAVANADGTYLLLQSPHPVKLEDTSQVLVDPSQVLVDLAKAVVAKLTETERNALGLKLDATAPHTDLRNKV